MFPVLDGEPGHELQLDTGWVGCPSNHHITMIGKELCDRVWTGLVDTLAKECGLSNVGRLPPDPNMPDFLKDA